MIRVINGQFSGMVGNIVQEIQPEIYLIRFGDGSTGIVTAERFCSLLVTGEPNDISKYLEGEV
ncbi:hypothetical protein [Enterococcus sp. N249-2]